MKEGKYCYQIFNAMNCTHNSILIHETLHVQKYDYYLSMLSFLCIHLTVLSHITSE